MDLGLRDHVVAITGASGGIGRACAEVFAAEGARLVLHAHTRGDALHRWIAERKLQERALAFAADVARLEELELAFDAAAERFGRIDHAVVNAGIWPSEDRLLHVLPPERLVKTLEVNLIGALWTARAFFRVLARSGPRPDGRGASLVFVGSTAGRFGERGHVDYAASKAALRGATLTLKNEIVALDPRGRVNLVDPGWTATDMAAPTLADPAALARITRTMPLQQVATPEDIARAIAVLASPIVSRHVTGELVTIAGGMEGRVQRGDGP